MGLWCVERATNRIADYSDDGSIRYDETTHDMFDGPTVGAAWPQYVYDGAVFTLRAAPKPTAVAAALDAVTKDAAVPQSVKDALVALAGDR